MSAYRDPVLPDVVCVPVSDDLVPLLLEHPTWGIAEAEDERDYRAKHGHPSERSMLYRSAG